MKRATIGILLVASLFFAHQDGEAARAFAPNDAPTSDFRSTPVPASEGMPFEIRTAANVDENLFMLHLLASYYEAMPDDASAAQISAWLADTRAALDRTRNALQYRRLDRDLDALFADSQRFFGTLEDSLVNLGAIEKRRSSQNATDLLAGAWEGAKNGHDAKSLAKDFGSSDETAGDIGVVLGFLTGIAEISKRQQQHDAEAAAAIERQKQILQAAATQVAANAKRTAALLTARYGWSPGEAGFDGFNSQTLVGAMKRRPRDPFAIFRYANTRVEKETAEDLFSDARWCIRAAELVPASPVYNGIRQDFVHSGADLAAMAASVETKSGYGGHPRLAAQVLSFSRTYLNLDPQDATGRGHMNLARGLAFSGRYREAVEAATQALNSSRQTWENDQSFCYRYASMLSLAGDRLDLVNAWLRQGYARGLGVDSVRDNPDLAAFRRAYPKQYEALTTVKLTYRIEFGIFLDDLILTNESPFEVTHLRGSMTIRKGQMSWTPQVNCPSIAPGGSCRMANVMSIPGDTYDEVSSALDCDQYVH